MSIEALGAAAGVLPGAGPAHRTVELTPAGGAGGASPVAEAHFQQALSRAGGLEGLNPGGQVSPAMKGMFSAVDQVNLQARSVADYAAQVEAKGGQLTPGEMVQLTMKCQEFMFQAQLTSNIANRSSDGLQQLFKQQ